MGSNLLWGPSATGEPLAKSGFFLRGSTKRKSVTYSRLKDNHNPLAIVLSLAHLDIIVDFLLFVLHLLGKRRDDSVLVLILGLNLLLATLGGSGALAGSLLGSRRGSGSRRFASRDFSMAALEVAHNGLAEVLTVLVVSKCIVMGALES